MLLKRINNLKKQPGHCYSLPRSCRHLADQQKLVQTNQVKVFTQLSAHATFCFSVQPSKSISYRFPLHRPLLQYGRSAQCCNACRRALLQLRDHSSTLEGWRLREQAPAIPTIRKSHTQDRNNNCAPSTMVPPCT